MWKKIASLAAMLSASLTVSSCETSAYRPVTYKPVPTGRTAKVPKIIKKPAPVRPTAQTVAQPRQFIPLNPAAPPGARQNIYGLPQ